MNTEKNFYDILRSKFSEQEHPFDEANWKTMRKMIDDSRAKKKRVLWLASSLVFLLMAGGTFALLEWKATGNGKSTIASSQNSTINNSSQLSVTNTKQATNSSAPVEANNLKNANNSQGSSTNQSPAANQTQANGNVAVASVNTAQQPKSAARHRHNRKPGGQKIAANTNESSASNIEAVDVVSNKTVHGDYPVVKDAIDSAPILTKTTPPLVQANLRLIVLHIKQTALKIRGSSEPQRFSDEPRIFSGKKQMISFEAGTLLTFGWDMGPNNTLNQGNGANYIFGVGYTRYLKAKWFLKTGIQFSEFGHMNTYSYNYESVSPQNSNVVNDSVITTKRLYYLSIPLQFEKFLGHKSSVGFGGTASYLLTTTASASAYQQLDNNPPINIRNYSQGIQLDGYNKWNATFYGLYRYTFNRHISAYFMLYFMTPVENKSFFGESNYLSNKGIKLIVSYTL